MRKYRSECRAKNRVRYRDIIRTNPELYAKHLANARASAKAQYLRYRKTYAILLGDSCYCCASKEKKLDTHHLAYPNGKHFNAHRTFKEVCANPWNFKRLCFRCHYLVTALTINSTNLPKIMEVVDATIGSRKGTTADF